MYTTVNVQHLESLNDVVAQITGVVVRETVPDRVLEQADEVELIDLPPDELLQRLHEGKVYVPQQVENAARNFFRKGNLIALRELALRRTADRVDAQMQSYMRDHAIDHAWPANEHILVCIGPNAISPRLVRATRRMATGLRAQWLVVYVETPAHAHLSEPERDQIIHTLRLAEQLGAETITLTEHKVSEAILDYARSHNVTKIVVGKPIKPRWRELLFGSIVDELVRGSDEIDVYVINGERDEKRTEAQHVFQRTSGGAAYGRGAVVVLVFTVIAWLMFPYFERSNLIMTYLLGVVFVATRYGRGPSIMASVLSVAAFDFFFVPPYLTFAVSDSQYLLTFAVMLLVAAVISTLTVRMQQQAEAARKRERRTAALYAMSRELAITRGLSSLLQTAVQHIGETFRSQVAVLLPAVADHLAVQEGDPTVLTNDGNDQGVAQWVYEHKEMAGLGTNTLPGATALYLPLVGSSTALGVLAVRPAQPRDLLEPEQFHLLETFANQMALALERARLADEAQHARVQVEAEQLRSSLLSSVSHDLRTPLATITGATTSLLDGEATLDASTRHDLTQAIYEEAEPLNRLVRNLLDMTRLEAGAVQLRREWQLLEEVVGTALTRLENQLRDHSIRTNLPDDLPLVPMDGVLIEQVFVNLLENALKYTPAGSMIEIAAELVEGAARIEVADRGPGLPPGDEQRVFDKFYRAHPADIHGVGLGLTICKGIVEAHGGRIWARNRAGGGATFSFTLPLDGTPPRVEAEVP